MGDYEKSEGDEGAGRQISSEEASKAVKYHAAKQKVEVVLSQDQFDAILAQWDEKDPREPAQINFVVEGKELGELTVAGYRYRGDTCCV